MWIITAGLVGLLGVLLLLFYRQRKEKLNLFKSLGIPGPEPHWLTGNASELMKNKHEVLNRWSAQYGTSFGYYEGPTPVLYTADPDILKQVMVKEFSKFSARKLFPVQPHPDSEMAHMFLSYGDRWKRLRTIINPTFSSSKLKQMFPHVQEKADVLGRKFTEAAASGESTNVHILFQGYTLDVIGTVAFGVEVDSQNNPDDTYLLKCRKIFDNLEKVPFIMSLGTYIPSLGKMLFRVYLLLMPLIDSPEAWVIKSLGDIIKVRKEKKSQHTDLLQLMLDAEVDVAPATKCSLAMTEDDNTPAATGSSNGQSTPPTPTSSVVAKHKLTTEEIKSQGLLFLIAGYETTSNALAYTTYLLANNPHKLKLLHEELDRVLDKETPVTYEQIQQLTYLDMCICESLRIYPIAATVVDRRCLQECVVSGIPFSPGMCVMANQMDLHMDPQIWGPQDPKEFEPDRFLPEEKSSRHPLAWIPFGAGPRNCVGLRFAMLEAKVALATILRTHTFEPCEETEIPLKIRLAATLAPRNGVIIKIAKREE